MPPDALLVAALFAMAAAPFLFDLFWSRRIASVTKHERARLKADLERLDRTWRSKIVWVSLSMPRPLPERARTTVRKGPRWSKTQTSQLAEDFAYTAGLWLLIGSLWAWGEGYSRWAGEVFKRAGKAGRS